MTWQKSSIVRPELSPRSVIRMLWKHKALIAIVWVLLSAVSIVGIYRLPAIYRAETLILVDSQKIPDRYVTSTVNNDVQDRLATISQQILSSTRLQKIIETYDLYREERKTLSQEEIIDLMRLDIKVTLEKGWTKDRPGAFRVAYQGPNPSIVAEVANRIANLYIEENLRAREVQAEGTTEFLENQLEEAKKRLDEQEAKVSQFKLEHNGELPQQENSLNGALTRLQIELQGNQEAISRAQQSKLLLENSLGIAEPELKTLQAAAVSAAEPASGAGRGTAATDDAGRTTTPQKRSDVLQAQVDALLVRYKDDHPDVRRLQAEIAGARRQEAEDARLAAAAPKAPASRPAPAAQPVPAAIPAQLAQDLVRQREKVGNLRAQVAAANRDLETLKAERTRILGATSSYQKRVERLPIREQQMAALTRDYEISKANYRSLLDKKFNAEMATSMERRQKGERFTVLDAASVPEKPFKPQRGPLSALGATLSLVIGICIAAGKELKRNSLLGEWELPAGVLVLGRVPLIGPDSDSRRTGGGNRFALPRFRIKIRITMPRPSIARATGGPV